LRLGVDVLTQVVADAPSVVAYQLSLGEVNRNLAIFLAVQGRLAEAEPLFRNDADFGEKLVREDPESPHYRARAADAAFHLGNLLVKTDRLGDGEKQLRRCLELRQPLAEEFPRVPRYHAELANAQEKLARVLRGRGDFAAARPLLEGAVSHQRAVLAMSPGAVPLGLVSSNCWLLADTLLRLGKYGEAAQAAGELPALCPDRWQECYQAARLLIRCVPLAERDTSLSEARRRELVEQYSRRAVELLREALRRGYSDVAQLKADANLDVLRSRDDFKQLLRDAESPPR
jgi:tetratricopeptide (TPR) repeat protein